MAVGTIGDLAVNSLEFFEFFDPNARLLDKSSTEVSLGSRDGYELVLQGDGFEFGKGNKPTDGTITSILLYDRHGDLVGKISDVDYSLVEYYQTVVKDGEPGKFTADLLSGDDQITGNFARDKLEGYGGDDDIAGGQGSDTLFGDGGDDTLSGGNGGDDMYGGGGDDVMKGGFGQDLMVGGGGNDDIAGEDASDRLDGAGGADTIDGGSGFDTILGGGGDDKLDGGAGGDDIEGQGGDDDIAGGDGNDLLGGGSGDDDISGGTGDDSLYGDSGDDSLTGDTGDDRLRAGGGDDTLQGGDGFDTLIGGGDNDTFEFVKQEQGSDLVVDFKRGEDVLAFDASGFDNLDASFDLVVGKNPEADTGDGTFLFNTKSHQLFWDANGEDSGQKYFIATLEGVKDLDKGDFLIV